MDPRLDIYKKSPGEIQELYGSIATAEAIGNASRKIGLATTPGHDIFVDIIGDIILGLYKKESLELLLQQKLNMTPEQTKWVHQELQPLLNKIPDEAIGGEAPTVLLTPPPELSTQPTPTPVKPMRTFPDDFNAGRAHSYGAFRPEGDDSDPDEPTHTTNQDDVLRK